jgi:hypothetical protein
MTAVALAAPVTLDVDDARFVLRRARRDDLSALIELLAADALRTNDDSTSALGLLGRFDQASAAMLSRAIDGLPGDDRAAIAAALPALERLRDEMQAIARTGDASGRPS